MGGKTPDSPDYRGAAEQQGQSSRENINMQTWANRPTVNTPWGNISWETGMQIDPATGQEMTAWTQNMTLNPNDQRALESQQQLGADRSGLAQGLYDRLSNEYANPVDWSQFQQYGAAPTAQQFDDADKYYRDAEDAIYGQFEQRAEPRFAQEGAAVDTQLRNQGLVPGTEAYDYQKQQLMQQQNDARQAAQYQATIGAGQEANRMLGMDMNAQNQFFNQGMASGNYQNTVRQQQIAEEMMRRGYTLNEVNAILTGQQVGMPQQPGFNTAGAAQPTDYTGAASSQGQADLDRYNAGQQGWQGALSGGAGIASAYLGRPGQ